VLVVSSQVPVRSMQELIAMGKTKPGTLNFASLGDGTAAHLSAEIFNFAAGLKSVHVPFKSVADSHSAILAGDVHYAVFLMPSSTPMLKGGRARAFAVTTKARSPALPDVPTVAEAGLAAAESETLIGVVAPANLPRELAARLSNDIVAVLKQPDTRARFAAQGAEPTIDTTPESYTARLKAEHDGYVKLLANIGLKR
jgi:tripartite-type tricarboxylate transporter receptor subunit TctC